MYKHMRNCSTNTTSVSFVYQLFKNYTNTTKPLSSSSSCSKDTLDNQSHLPHRHFFLALTHSATDAADFFLFLFNPSILFLYFFCHSCEWDNMSRLFFFTICRFFCKNISRMWGKFLYISEKFWVIFFFFCGMRNFYVEF